MYNSSPSYTVYYIYLLYFESIRALSVHFSRRGAMFKYQILLHFSLSAIDNIGYVSLYLHTKWGSGHFGVAATVPILNVSYIGQSTHGMIIPCLSERERVLYGIPVYPFLSPFCHSPSHIRLYPTISQRARER